MREVATTYWWVKWQRIWGHLSSSQFIFFPQASSAIVPSRWVPRLGTSCLMVSACGQSPCSSLLRSWVQRPVKEASSCLPLVYPAPTGETARVPRSPSWAWAANPPALPQRNLLRIPESRALQLLILLSEALFPSLANPKPESHRERESRKQVDLVQN